jgi:hypothetical protein
MARAILGTVFFACMVLASPVWSAERFACSKAPSAAKANVRQLQQHLSAGPFYRAMTARHGKPRTCTVEMDGGKTSMSYLFRGGARVSAKVDPAVEYSEERADVERMDPAKAMTLLKDAERYAYRPNGCGMKWTDPEEERSATAGLRDVIYRGGACNCQARLTYAGNYVVALVLRTAC